jgi:hypothetical protein
MRWQDDRGGFRRGQLHGSLDVLGDNKARDGHASQKSKIPPAEDRPFMVVRRLAGLARTASVRDAAG